MGHGEGNGLISISPFLKLPPLNTPYALSAASQEQRFYNCNEKLEGNFNINEKNCIPRCTHSSHFAIGMNIPNCELNIL